MDKKHPHHLGLFILLASIIWSFAFYRAKVVTSRQTISVTGVAYQDVTSDLADWSFTLERRDSGRKNSYDNLLSDEKNFLDHLKKLNITDSEIRKGTYHTFPVYRKENYTDTDEIIAYTSTINYSIVGSDISKIANIADNINAYLIANNLTLSQNYQSYTYNQLEGLKISLLEAAIKNAESRAKAIGKTTHSRIGKIVNASQGIFQVNPRNDYSVSGEGNFDTSSIGKTIRATVSVDFELK